MNRVHKVLAFSALLAWNASAQVEQDSADIARYVMQENMRRQEQEQQQQSNAIQETARQGGNIGGGGGSINPSALQGQGSQKKGKDANDSAGAALMAAGAAMMATPQTMPIGIALMAMGMLAKKQADEDNNAANQSGMTAAASQFGGASGTNGSGTTAVNGQNPNVTTATGTSSIQDPKIKAALKKMEDAGYKVTEQGLHKPDGTLVPASAFNSASSMSAAGFDPATVREAQKVLGVINEELARGKYGSLAMSEGLGGAAGGGSSYGGSSGGSESDSFKPFNPFGLGADQKRALIAGKTVLLDGEPIGVRGNNIFEMMHFAYEKRRNGRQFIETEGAAQGPSLRSPASVTPKVTGR